MKKMIFASAIFLIILSNLVFASVSLDIKWQTATDTLRPGSETTIALTLSNTGTTDLTNVVITPSGGPSVVPTSGKIELGGLPISSSSQASVSVRVEKTAESKTSYVYLKVEYYTGTGTYEKSFTIPITIKREPILQITGVNYSDTLSPGKTITLTFNVKNSGTGPAKDLIVSLNQTDKLFSVPGSAGEMMIDSLNAGETAQAAFIITLDPDADVGINSIPVNLRYYDETKTNSYSDTKYIGLTITGKVDFIITVQEALGGNIKLSIANRGTAPAEYLTIKVLGKTEKDYYIGTLDSGDYETIDIPQTGVGTYDILLKIEYKDKFNNEYTEEKTVSVTPSMSINPLVIIILLAVAGGSYWYYIKKYKKK